jgi:hypothetical protein
MKFQNTQFLKNNKAHKNLNKLTSLMLIGAMGMSASGCQQQAAEENGSDAFVTESSPKPAGEQPGGSDLPPSIDPAGENWVNCSNVETFNAELKKISNKALECSHSSSETTVLENFDLKDLKNPSTTQAFVFIRSMIGFPMSPEDQALEISYNDSDLRRDDPINLFFTVKVAGTCGHKDFKLHLDEGRSNSIYVGGNLNFWTAPRNFTFKARSLLRGEECMRTDVDITNTKKSLVYRGQEIYREAPAERVGDDHVFTYIVNGVTWKIKENHNFSACTSNPSYLSVHGSTSIGIGTSTGSAGTFRQLSALAVQKIELYKFKPSTKFYNTSLWTDAMRSRVERTKEVHNYSCVGYRNNFTW